jgi:hypothetical protein
MKNLKNAAARCCLSLMLSACCFAANAGDYPAQTRLDACIAGYQNGDYQKTADSLRALVRGLVIGDDEMRAYKYLGFSYAMLNWIDLSKEAFKTALEKFPTMDIDTLEVPPNITLIFKQAKLEIKLAAMDAALIRTPPVVVVKKTFVAPTILLTTGILSAGAGAGFFYFGFQKYQKYKSLDAPDQSSLDYYYTTAGYYYIAAGIGACVAAVLIPVSIHLFTKKEPGNKAVKISIVNGTPSLVVSF